MSVSINGTTGLVFNDGSTQPTAASGFGFKNRIINGAMVIDQRNAGASVTITTSAYTLDRWQGGASQTSKYSVQQNAGAVTPPAGFINYLGVTSLSSYSVLSSDNFFLQQPIEGLNVADFGWGTVNAVAVTLSFWVRSSLTGTFGGTLVNSANNYAYPFTYAISAANTWEQKTVTVAGPTAGTWLTTNGVGVRLNFGLGCGSTNSGTAGAWVASNFTSATGAVSVVGTNGATFYITGVQLEKGSTATSFDYRPYGTEEDLCKRYFQKLGGTQDAIIGQGLSGTTSEAVFYVKFITTMRSQPTFSQTSLWATDNINYNATVNSLGTINTTLDSARVRVNTNSVMTQYRPASLVPNGTGTLTLSAEL
jgi:hypothetical protein